MEFMLNKIEREDLLADVMTEITQSKTKRQIESEVYVDPNFQYSDDAKFGNRLAQDDRAWNNYFGIVK
jgi:hypothetical protein